MCVPPNHWTLASSESPGRYYRSTVFSSRIDFFAPYKVDMIVPENLDRRLHHNQGQHQHQISDDAIQKFILKVLVTQST